MATSERKQRLTEVLEKRRQDITVVLENIADPHNMSACLRSCDAIGISEVWLLYHGGQAFPAAGHASSASAKKWLDYRKYDDVGECFAAIRASGKKIYTTHLAADSVSLYELDLAQPVALVFGNEHKGVSPEALALADGNFLIPQVGMIRSLNISVACAVSVYEAFRQKLEAGHYDNPSLDAASFETKLAEWLEK